MILSIEKLHFSFKTDTPIFNNFSFSLKENEIITLIGNSGCGKSTLLNIISGLLMKQSGIITNNAVMAYLTQTVTLLHYRTAFENCLLACDLRNTFSKEKIRQVEILYHNFSLDENSKNKFPKELSGGMQQRIGIIQTILIDAELYLFDEPFNAIDRSTTLKIQDYLWNKIRNESKSSIFVTHDIDQSIQISDKVLLISNNGNKYKEISFDKDFTSLTPFQRQKTERYNEYLFQIIKTLSDL